MSADTTFQRVLYSLVVMDVRKSDPNVNLRDAWVYKLARGHWEFHYKDFYWHGGASGAFDARAKGWSAYLDSKTKEQS